MNIILPLDRKILLFGFQEEQSNSPMNYIILCVKYFIWKTKLQNCQLSFIALQRFIKNKVEDLKNAFLYEDKMYKFDPFLVVYNSLSSLEWIAVSQEEQELPTTTLGILDTRLASQVLTKLSAITTNMALGNATSALMHSRRRRKRLLSITYTF